jgi:hypothetical protein
MGGKHRNELEKYQQHLLEKSKTMKPSSERLELRRVQEIMAKTRNYDNAQSVKEEAARLEVIETKRWMEKRQEDVSKQENQLKEKQLQTVNALKQRIQTQQEKWHGQRQREMER